MSRSTPHSLLKRILGSSDDSLLPDAQRFLQSRVKLYLKILFWFFVFFLVLGMTKAFILVPRLKPEWLLATQQGNIIIVVLLAALGGGWFYLRGEQKPLAMLHLIESGGTVAGMGVVALLVPLFPPGVPEIALILVMVLALVVRAALVPSATARTAVVGLLCTAIIAIPMYKPVGSIGTEENFFTPILWIVVIVWGTIFTITTMIVSRVIYGLQQKVREAMQLGNYTLQERLGEGGMGTVYLARHALLTRPTAVKLLPPDKAGEQNVARFEREVQQTSRLMHPNTVRIFDYGRTPEGIFYYAMEYLDGLTLEELVAMDGAQPPGRVIYALTQVAHALAEAHREGLIHRDIKPANIVLCDRGGAADTAKVLDFGLIKDISAPKELALSTTDAITGTPQYLAPESLTAPDKVDGRTDIYALSAVGYFMLTGQPVFDGATVVEVCSHHLNTAPTPPSVRLGKAIADDLEAVLLRGLAKLPESRFQTANALREALFKCRDANTWGLTEASQWWSRYSEKVQSFLEKKRQSKPADSVADRPFLSVCKLRPL